MLPYTPMRLAPLVALVLFLLGSLPLDARTRFHEYTEQFYSPRDGAQPLAASYLGGGGNEYLAGAAFLPDGGLLLAGNALGPEFSLSGVQVSVIGSDAASAPNFSMPRGRNDNIDRIRSWQQQQGAGFVVQLSPDYRRIVRAVRLPWNSGVITDLAIDGQGQIWLTGRTGERFADLGNARPLGVDGFAGDGESFIAKLSPNWGGVAWLARVPDDAESTPALRYLGNGIMSWVGEHGLHLNSAGEAVHASLIGYSRGWMRGFNFENFEYATGGMRHTRTGYEPWIQPAVHMYNNDQTYRFRTHEWDPRLAGTNFSRLISDSATHVLNFDRQGNLIISGWSDGGNSVFAHVPYDLTRHMEGAVKEVTGRDRGLPFSTWGAGIGSFAHLVKLDPETARPLNYSLFISYLAHENRPNSVTMQMVDTAVDNSLLLSGGSAWGLIQTGSTVVNTLDWEVNDYIGGDFIAILNEDWNNIRYSSAVPGAGRVVLHRRNDRNGNNFRADSVQIGNKTRVVFFGGAAQDEKFKPINPLQPFSGGDIDGLFVVLEMDTLAPATVGEPPFPTAGSREAGVGDGDEGLSGRFMINRGMRNDHCVIVLRDSQGNQWPTFYRGRPVGENTIEASGSGEFTIIGESNRVQLRGGTLNPMRVGGSADRVDFPEITLGITFQDATRSRVVIEFDGRRIEKEGRHSIRNARPVARGSLDLRGLVTVTRGELGLAPAGSAAARDEIHIQWWAPARPLPGGSSAQPEQSRNQGGGNRESATEQAASPQAPSEPEIDRNAMRTWTDTQGRTIEARLVQVRGENVTIRRADGQIFTIPLEILSEADREFLR